MHLENPRSREDAYRDFIEFIRADIQKERLLVHRKMFSAVLWCFILPAAVSTTILLLIKCHVLPVKSRALLDWLALLFPVCYSLYVLGSEVVTQAPTAFRRGGVATSLGQALKESEWRKRVREEMNRSLKLDAQDWRWVLESFRADLASMQYRTRYLTALAGAVFFLIMQGIDALGGADLESSISWTRNPITGWTETSTYDVSQFVGLTLFLVLLYLSGNQTYHSLTRYLRCAELNLLGQQASRSDR